MKKTIVLLGTAFGLVFALVLGFPWLFHARTLAQGSSPPGRASLYLPVVVAPPGFGQPAPTLAPTHSSGGAQVTSTATPSSVPTQTATLGAPATPTSTSTPTQTLAPTGTSTPTETPTPTFTPAPSDTPTPTPTSTPSVTPDPACPGNLLACWQFNTPSGTRYLDAAWGRPAECPLDTCPASTSGKVQRGLYFNGTDQGLTVTDPAFFQLASQESFSVELWVKTGQSCANTVVFVGQDAGPTAEGSWWLGCGPGNVAAFYLSDSQHHQELLQGTRLINDDNWHHLVAVRDAAQSENRLYVDHFLEAVSQVAYQDSFASQGHLTIGFWGGGHYYLGKLDELAFYGRALSTLELNTHYFLARAYCQACSTPVRIMPLGASFTEGYGSTDDAGYRRPLYNDLLASGYQVNFVGSLKNGPATFDNDHEGHGGWHAEGGATGGIAPHIYDWLVANPADVILLHIGTNDISNGDQDPAEVGHILDEIDRYDKDITVVLALIINRRSYSLATTQFNQGVRAMAEQRIANGDKIVIVDMEPVLNYQTDMFDNLHPNDAGYLKTEQVWYNALTSFLPVCNGAQNFFHGPEEFLPFSINP